MKKMFIGIISFVLILFSTFVVSMLSDESTVSGGRIHTQKPISLPVDSAILKENTLLFLGYVGCPDICTPRMFEILKIYEQYKKESNSNDLNVLFISLKSDESPQLVDDFAKSFNSSFIGTTTSHKYLLRLTRTLNAYFTQSLTNNETIEHTESLYLIKKEQDGSLYLKYIYMKVPYNKELIVSDLIKDEQ